MVAHTPGPTPLGAIALLVSYLEYQGKSSFHYRKLHALKALRNERRVGQNIFSDLDCIRGQDG
jgi:hypothetical protein